jgi:hypothetical protein
VTHHVALQQNRSWLTASQDLILVKRIRKTVLDIFYMAVPHRDDSLYDGSGTPLMSIGSNPITATILT